MIAIEKPLATSFLLGLLSILLVAAATPHAEAQELRVFTQVTDRSPLAKVGSPNPVVSKSLTIFRAGKVYDYIESLQEVTIYEPAHARFTILNEARRTKTEISQDEIRRFLALAEQETEKLLRDLSRQRTPADLRAADALEFQLRPEFEQTWEKNNRLVLSADAFRYTVECAPAPTSEALATYLRFADWTAQLNSVLHPCSLLPRPRLVLNKALEQHRVLPTSVELEVAAETKLHLRAEHQLTWSLNAVDRELIHHWEQLQKGTALKTVNFRQFQQHLATASIKSR